MNQISERRDLLSERRGWLSKRRRAVGKWSLYFRREQLAIKGSRVQRFPAEKAGLRYATQGFNPDSYRDNGSKVQKLSWQ